MAAAEASHTASQDGDPPTPYPSVPRTPTPPHTHSGERPHPAPLQGPTTQLLRPRQTFTFLIISSWRLPGGCLGQGWGRSELYPGGWASPLHCFLPGELAVRGDHSNRMHVLAPHTEAPKQAGHTDRHTEGQAGIRPDFPTEHSAHTAGPYSRKTPQEGKSHTAPSPGKHASLAYSAPSPQGPLGSWLTACHPRAFSLWSALAASLCTISATHSGLGGPGMAAELCGPTDPAPVHPAPVLQGPSAHGRTLTLMV